MRVEKFSPTHRISTTGSLRVAMSQFKMIVKDKFVVQGERTIFIGKVQGHDGIVKPCSCTLMIGDIPRATFGLDGEDFVENTDKTLRALSTTERVEIDEITLDGAVRVLICHY